MIFASAAFSPLSLSPALWLSDTGSDPAQWDDLSGNGRHALQAVSADQPAILTGNINGRQVRSFGAGDWMLSFDSGANSRGDLTIVAVHRYDSLSSSNNAWEQVCGHGQNNSDSPTGAMLLQRMANSNLLGAHNSGVSATNNSVDTGSGGLLIPRISMIRRSGGTNGNGGAVTVRSNSLTTTGTQSWDTVINTNGMKIGGKQQTVTEFFVGVIAEVIIFPRAITDVEVNSLFSSLSGKYNISIS